MDRNLLDYLPDVVRAIREFQSVMGTEQPEAAELWDCLADALDDQFIGTALESGIIRWESILNISSKETDTLDERRFRITTRMTEKLPYTWRRLEDQLKTICGPDGYILTLSGDEFLVTIRVALTSKKNYDSAKEMVERVMPANMVLDISLLYNQHKTLHKFTVGKLGQWIQWQIRNEVLQ